MVKYILFSNQQNNQNIQKILDEIFPEYIRKKRAAFMPSQGLNNTKQKYIDEWKNWATQYEADFCLLDNACEKCENYEEYNDYKEEHQKLRDSNILIISGGNTYQLLLNLRQSGFDRAIIALTASARDQDVKSFYDAGCTGFVSKPIDRANFYATLNEHLKHNININQKRDSKQQKTLDALKLKFITTLPDSLDKIKTAITEKDLESLKILLHNLKGMGGSFGCPEISQCALELENTLETTSIDNMLDEIKSLEKAIQELSL